MYTIIRPKIRSGVQWCFFGLISEFSNTLVEVVLF